MLEVSSDQPANKLHIMDSIAVIPTDFEKFYCLFVTRWALSPISVNAYYDMLANKMGKNKIVIHFNYQLSHGFA